ncbi:hypothetical protein, partial [Enterobacter intestinihominis]
PGVFFLRRTHKSLFLYFFVVLFFFYNIMFQESKPKKITGYVFLDLVWFLGVGGMFFFFNWGFFLNFFGLGRDPPRDPVSHLRLNHHRSHHNGPTKETYRSTWA